MSFLRQAFDVMMPMPSAPSVITISFSTGETNKRLTLHGHHNAWVLEEGIWGLRMENDDTWRERAMSTEKLEEKLRVLQRTEPSIAMRVREELAKIEDEMIDKLVETHPLFALDHLCR